MIAALVTTHILMYGLGFLIGWKIRAKWDYEQQREEAYDETEREPER